MIRQFSLNKTDLPLLLLFISGMAVSFLIVEISAHFSYDVSLYLSITGFLIFVICSAGSVGFELMHPFVWFNIPFMVCSVSAPVLYLISEAQYYPTYYDVIYVEYIGLLVFSVFLRIRFRPNGSMDFRGFELLTLGNTWFFVLSLVLALVCLGSFMAAGLENKQEKNVIFSQLLMIDFSYYFMNICFCIFLINNCIRRAKFKFKYVAIFIFFLVLTLSITGERSHLYRFVIIVIFTYHLFYKRIKGRYLVALFLIGIYLQSFLGSFKMFFITREMVDLDLELSLRNIVKNMLGSEIITASSNLAVLMQMVPDQIPFAWGKAILWDFQRAIIPGFLLPREIVKSSASWFTETFYYYLWNSGGGIGFSIVGVGYFNFGTLGVVGIFLLMGIVVKRFYILAKTSIWWAIFYINFIPVFLSTIRGDLSTPISQSLKHIIFPLFVIAVFGAIKKKTLGAYGDRRWRNKGDGKQVLTGGGIRGLH